VLSKFWDLCKSENYEIFLAMFGPLKQMLPDIDFFVNLHDDRTTHKYELMFWEQNQNQPCKIIKNFGQRHQDQ
jgi:hypothetical protein